MAKVIVTLKNKQQYDLVTKKLLGLETTPSYSYNSTVDLQLLQEVKTLVSKKGKDNDELSFAFEKEPPWSFNKVTSFTKKEVLGKIESIITNINTWKEVINKRTQEEKEAAALEARRQQEAAALEAQRQQEAAAETSRKLAEKRAETERQLLAELKVVEELKKEQLKEAENYVRRLQTKTRQRGATFRKAYSTVTTLTPAVTCSISYSLLKTSTPKDLQIFDVPYNYIKSLKVEMKGSPETTVMTLSLEEPSGNVSSLLVAYLYQQSSGISKALPQINVQWGWGTNERTLSSLATKGLHSTTLKQTYTINKAEVSYEGLKQKVQLQCGLDFNTQEIFKENASPKAVFGDSIVSFLVRNRLIVYHSTIENLSSFGIKTTIPRLPLQYTIEQPGGTSFIGFASESYEIFKNKVPFLNNFSLTKNLYFNTNVYKVSEVTKELAQYLDRSVHPYTVFCCVLNNMLTAYTYNLKPNKAVLVLPLFREANIINYESVIYRKSLYSKSTTEDRLDIVNLIKAAVLYSSNIRTDKDCPNLNQVQTKVENGDTWISLVQKYASLVKLKYKNETYELSANVVQTDSRVPLIVEELNKYLGDYSGPLKLTEAVLSKYAYVVFIAPKNLNFSQSRAPVQSYTVFPKSKPETKPNRSYFNSGSKNLVDESFPDVIEFKPKLDLIGAIDTGILERKFSPNYSGTRTEKWYFTNETVNTYKAEELADFQQEFLKKLKEGNFTLTKKDNFWAESTKPNYLMYFQTLKGETEAPLIFKKESKSDEVKATVKKGKSYSSQLLLDDLNSTLLLQSEDEKNTFGAITHTLFVKSQNVSLSDTSSSAYASFVAKSAEYFKKLKQSTFSFEAELKILGEPAYCNYQLMSGQVIKIYLKVNNPDGSENVLLTGVYMVEGATHEIDEGKFTTTLKLRYDQPNLEYYQT